MVEVGSLEIVGKINTSSIEKGLSNIGRGLDMAKSKAQDAFGDMENLSGVLGGIGDKLSKIGVGATGAFLGLAALGPAVAPALARMQVSFFEMTRTISESLAPAFESFADLFEDFVGWLDSSEGKGVLLGINNVLTNVVGGAKDALIGLNALGKTFTTVLDFSLGDGVGNDLVKWLIENGSLPLLATFLGGPVAGVATLGLQQTGNYMQAREDDDIAGQLLSGALAGGSAGGLLGAGLGTFVFPGVGTAVGGGLGALGGAASGILTTVLVNLLEKNNSNEVMSSSNNFSSNNYSNNNSNIYSPDNDYLLGTYRNERDYNREQNDYFNFTGRNT